MGMLRQTRLLLSLVEEMGHNLRDLRRPNLHELERQFLRKQYHALRKALRDLGASRASRPNGLPSRLRLRVRILGALQRGVRAVADNAAQSASREYLADSVRASPEFRHDSCLQAFGRIVFCRRLGDAGDGC